MSEITPTTLMNAAVTLAMLAAIGFGLRGVTRTRLGRWVLLVMGLMGLAGWAWLGFPLPGPRP